VPTAQRLFERHIRAPYRDGRHLQRRQLPHVFGMMLCDGPSEACAPVVPDNGRLTCAAMTYETEHVVHQLLDPVVFDPARFCAQVITAQVGRDDAEVLTERRQLMPPRV